MTSGRFQRWGRPEFITVLVQVRVLPGPPIFLIGLPREPGRWDNCPNSRWTEVKVLVQFAIPWFESRHPSHLVQSLEFGWLNVEKSPQNWRFSPRRQSLEAEDSNRHFPFPRKVSRVFLGNSRFAESKSGDWFESRLSGGSGSSRYMKGRVTRRVPSPTLGKAGHPGDSASKVDFFNRIDPTRTLLPINLIGGKRL